MKKILIVAFHFPPQAGSSGYLRTLKFCRYLPEYGWQPSILTVNPRAYGQTDPSVLSDIPASVEVRRAFALDSQRHLSFRGRYPRMLALPDRWVSWCLGAIPAGLKLLREQQADAIMSTFPIASAILIAWILHRLTGKPWIADFRDSMTEPHYPGDPLTWRVHRRLEKIAVRNAAALTFTASSTVRMYLERYPELSPSRCSLISNGYDEEDFRHLVPGPSAPSRPIRLVHMGLLYPVERDPRPFFRALSQLQENGTVDPSRVRIELRASGFDSIYEPMIRAAGLENLVHLLPPLPYREALQDSANADGLLLFQAACCDHQIPAKVFEYLRLGKPILALTSDAGDTAILLRETGGATIVDSADCESIYRVLPEFLKSVEMRSHPQAEPSLIEQYSRKGQAQALAHLLNQVVRSDSGSSR